MEEAGSRPFTACHELGHLLMHRQQGLKDRSEDYPIYRDSEWQADTFAGALMMSPGHVQRFDDEYEMAEACGATYAAAEVMWAKYEEAGLLD